METFLKKLAQHVFDTHGNELDKICIVFPNRRASLYFRQHLSNIITQTVWCPELMSLEDFVLQISGMKLSDPLLLLVKLYKVYKNIQKGEAQSFNDFITWGNILLSDFDEVDQNLADCKKVFTELNEIKSIENWHPDGSELTEFERNYLNFYHSLADCYCDFRELLISENEGYFGLIIKTLLSDIQHIETNKWNKIIFAGFNALTQAETQLFSYLYKEGKAEIIFDSDNYYMNDENQEAGIFLRKYAKQKTFGDFHWLENNLLQQQKNINILGVPSNIGQAKMVGEISSQFKKETLDHNQLAVVLIDESLLLPTLNSIPESYSSFNVTMGYPLKQTPVFIFIDSLLSLFANALNIKLKHSSPNPLSSLRFYHKDILLFLGHPYIRSIQQADKHNNITIDKTYYTIEQLIVIFKNISPDLAKIIEQQQNQNINAHVLLEIISSILTLIANQLQETNKDNPSKSSLTSLDAEYIYHTLSTFEKLKIITQDQELNIELQNIQSIINTLLSGINLPFYGEPLEGLQIMGMLETRLLDFENIIIVSANEGLLPKSNNRNTFIPDEVRRTYNLLCYHEKSSVFAYHFYRLLQRSKNSWILYNTEGDELGGGEKSRFIVQLEHELQLKNKEATIVDNIISSIPKNQKGNCLDVAKNETVVQRLHQIAENGISPSALSMYLRCNLQFYYSKVLQIGEPDQVSESIDAAELGTIVHDVLQNLYEPYIQKFITADDIATMIPLVPTYLKQTLEKEYQNNDLLTGRNVLIIKVAETIIDLFLKKEKKILANNTRIQILQIEEPLETSIQFHDQQTDKPITVKLHGKADRIDSVNGIIRIVDYKTGNVDKKNLQVETISEFRDLKSPYMVLQVLSYAIMYADKQKIKDIQVKSGIISLRNHSENFFEMNINENSILTSNELEEFREELKLLLKEIFNTTIPFAATHDEETCSYCAYSKICNR